jgi:hypothetical protein
MEDSRVALYILFSERYFQLSLFPYLTRAGYLLTNLESGSLTRSRTNQEYWQSVAFAVHFLVKFTNTTWVWSFASETLLIFLSQMQKTNEHNVCYNNRALLPVWLYQCRSDVQQEMHRF